MEVFPLLLRPFSFFKIDCTKLHLGITIRNCIVCLFRSLFLSSLRQARGLDEAVSPQEYSWVYFLPTRLLPFCSFLMPPFRQALASAPKGNLASKFLDELASSSCSFVLHPHSLLSPTLGTSRPSFHLPQCDIGDILVIQHLKALGILDTLSGPAKRGKGEGHI